jgi:hypothetical protein
VLVSNQSDTMVASRIIIMFMTNDDIVMMMARHRRP